MPKTERFFLIVRAPNGDIREVPLGTHAIVLGRDESADIRVDDKKVSRRHSAFKLLDGEPWVEDLGSSNGVRVNGKKINKRARMKYGDTIRVGGFHVSLKDGVEDTGASMAEEAPPPKTRSPRIIERRPEPKAEDQFRLLGNDPPVKGKTFVVHKGENIVGRLEECDVPILDGSVSRQHARLVYANDKITVTDLGSSNGVFVNEVRVDMAELADGDQLRIGNVGFDVALPRSLASHQSVPLKTRARAKKSATSRRWIMLGAIGLFLAAFVVSSALFWRARRRAAGESDPLAMIFGSNPDADGADAGSAGTPDAGGVVVAVAAPPATKPPPSAVEPPPVVEPPPPPAKRLPSNVRPPPTSPPPSKGPSTPLVAARVATATAPFSRRDASGLPLNLPLIDDTFDFDEFVTTRMSAAKACQEKADWKCLRTSVREVLNVDPINDEAAALNEKVVLYEAAEQALAKADAFAEKGQYANAYQVLADVPDELPQAAAAKERAKKLRHLAIEDQLASAEREITSRRTWRKAHRRYKKVLELDGSNTEALKGLRSVEKKMRRRNMSYSAYEPRRTNVATTNAATPDLNVAIVRHFDGDKELAAVAKIYRRGAIDKAIRRADALSKRGSGVRRRRARRMKTNLRDIEKRFSRIRTEITNDPARAWSRLRDLQNVETKILPKGVKSFVVRELEVSLSEAYGEQGASMFDRGRFQDAFERWESGYKLDATNPKVVAGLKKLETKAEQYAQEAELAAQRGDRDVCERWKKITRMTNAQSEVHQTARKRALVACR